jgi:hypothetical protein
MTRAICRMLMFPVFHLALKPLIIADYKKRALGLKPDKWHWADEMAVKFGYYASFNK